MFVNPHIFNFAIFATFLYLYRKQEQKMVNLMALLEQKLTRQTNEIKNSFTNNKNVA